MKRAPHTSWNFFIVMMNAWRWLDREKYREREKIVDIKMDV